LMGGRLPEGSTTLPDGFKFKFIKVDVNWEKYRVYTKEKKLTCCVVTQSQLVSFPIWFRANAKQVHDYGKSITKIKKLNLLTFFNIKYLHNSNIICTFVVEKKK
jgi:hypothetical protein